ncbi:hypothetical protein QJU96_02770 [Pasteurella skyensis]|uniref:Uncharacterized protein n=1 Tax=Phocoenobacter skyensis TaxID=97481 RepID=A0AAJ6P262_9PAST|nr:hypothetical protein [Pasteurella skyensis]MDP8170212.1 hypothetical protein [Pasteurella skyensis]MDP8174467.1 hypothetical protein [Pasteurella skyensis]
MFNFWNEIHNNYTSIITFFDDIGIIITFSTLVFTLWNFLSNYKNNKKLNKNIQIKLLCEGKKPKILLQTIKRRYFTRSEVQGILGNCYAKEQRYDSSFLSTRIFSKQLEKVQNGESDILEITLTSSEEFDKFQSSE